MKVSEETLTIIDNFSKINPGILVHPGKGLGTIHPSRNIIADATVEDDFPTEFAIYDLSRFLGAVSLLKDPDFAFGEKSVLIQSGKSMIEYIYANPKNVQAAPAKRPQMPSEEIKFFLSAEDLKLLQKAAGTMQLANLVIKNHKDRVMLEVQSVDTPSSNKFQVQLEDPCTGNFKAVFEFGNLKILPGNYDVVVSTKKISEFVSRDRKLTYWILLNLKESKFS